MVAITALLYLRPAEELCQWKGDVSEQEIKRLGQELCGRLGYIARGIGILTDRGWKAEMWTWDVFLTNPKICNAIDAIDEVNGLNLDPAVFRILSWESEDDEPGDYLAE